MSVVVLLVVLVRAGPKLGVLVVLERKGDLWLMEVRVIPENPVSILSGDVTGCEWVDSACIRFNK